jgi:hypothetical protein
VEPGGSGLPLPIRQTDVDGGKQTASVLAHRSREACRSSLAKDRVVRCRDGYRV